VDDGCLMSLPLLAGLTVLLGVLMGLIIASNSYRSKIRRL